MLEPAAVPEVLHDGCGDMVGHDCCDLNLWVRADLPSYREFSGRPLRVLKSMRTLHEQCFSSLQEAQFAFRSSDRIKLPVCFKPICGVVGVKDGA